MKTPLLSICIATYNRAGYIGETLDTIIPQLDDDIELLVVDGASTDNTEEIVRQYAVSEPRIRYIRLSAKGGADQDYDKSVQLARGEFCWLFTDDDLLKPGAVAAVKTAIREGNGLIIVNAEVRDRELATLLSRRQLAILENKVYTPDEMEFLFKDALTYLSFIGAVVIRRSIWLGRQRESYFGSDFIHVGMIFQMPLPEPALIIAEPYICIRYGMGQWIPLGFDIWMFKWPKLVWSFDYISASAKQSIVLQEPWRKMKNLMLQRGRGSYTPRHYKEHFSSLPEKRIWKVGAWLISRLPAKALACLLYYYARLTGAGSLFLFDLKLKARE